MRRLHLFEIEDQPWCPRAVRDGVTDYLRFAIEAGKVYAPAVPVLADAQVLLTDLAPNAEAFRRAEARSGGAVRGETRPVDAARVPADLRGFRTIFSALHHFRPAEARAVLADAVARGEGFAAFDGTARSAPALLAMLLVPLMMLLVTPAIRPFRWSRLLLTYVLPLIPLAVLWDGVVSCLRTYTPEELSELARGLDGHAWRAGELRAPRQLPITYLVGLPRAGAP